MQSISKEIQNPVFFLSFFGTVLMLPLTTWYTNHHASPAAFYFILSASIFYIVGVLGVTVFGNIPLNEALEVFNIDSANPAELSEIFEAGTGIRTVCSIFSLACTIAAIIKYRKSNISPFGSRRSAIFSFLISCGKQVYTTNGESIYRTGKNLQGKTCSTGQGLPFHFQELSELWPPAIVWIKRLLATALSNPAFYRFLTMIPQSFFWIMT
jgi:hypothetical protein